MLTEEFVLRVARLLDQTGEPRSNNEEDQANLKGHPTTAASRAVIQTPERYSSIRLKIRHETDPITGHQRLVKEIVTSSDEDS